MKNNRPFMDKFFNPESVVVFGVSTKLGNLASITLVNLVHLSGYRGKVFAVGRPHRFLDVEVLPDASGLPDGIDLAVVLSPAATLPGIIRECGRLGIGSMVVESGGFTEYSESGAELTGEVLRLARSNGVRILGPNCLGVIDLDSRLATPFVPLQLPETQGDTVLFAQSGGVGIGNLTEMKQHGLYPRRFVALGNKIDLDEVDFLRHLAPDPALRTFSFYLESIARGRELLEAVPRRKDARVIIHKANRSDESNEAAFSHTAAVLNDDRVVDTAFRQAGIVRVNKSKSMITAIRAAGQPASPGRRVAVLSRSGGHAVIACDALASAGLGLASFSDRFYESLKNLVPSRVIPLSNPLDLGELFDFTIYPKIIEAALAEEEVDGLLFIHVTAADVELSITEAFLKGAEKTLADCGKPVSFCVGVEDGLLAEFRKEFRLPLFSSPEEAAEMFAYSREFAAVEAAGGPGLRQTPDALINAAAVQVALNIAPTLLEGVAALRLLDACGIPVPRWRDTGSPEEAAAAAAEIGCPVVLKLLTDFATHKADIDAVRLGLESPEAVDDEAEKMLARVKKMRGESCGIIEPWRFLVQEYLPGGFEMFASVVKDASFGPVVSAGTGGAHMEQIRDSSLRLGGASKGELLEMIGETAAGRIMANPRAGARFHRDGVADVLARLGEAALLYHRIEELEINPLAVSADRVVALDARLRLS